MASITKAITHEIPYLRRYARAACGDSHVADAYVYRAVERLLDYPALLGERPIRIELYRLLYELCASERVEAGEQFMLSKGHLRMAHRCLAKLPLDYRHAILLHALEDLSFSEIAYVLNRSERNVSDLITAAGKEILNSIYADILIIEDEALVACDLSIILRELGHNVLPVAATREEAVRTAQYHTPSLILADIELANESSGVDAVREICSERAVPTIFITAYPERLIVINKPEVTILLPKPYQPDVVKRAVNRALFMAPC